MGLFRARPWRRRACRTGWCASIPRPLAGVDCLPDLPVHLDEFGTPAVLGLPPRLPHPLAVALQDKINAYIDAYCGEVDENGHWLWSATGITNRARHSRPQGPCRCTSRGSTTNARRGREASAVRIVYSASVAQEVTTGGRSVEAAVPSMVCHRVTLRQRWSSSWNAEGTNHAMLEPSKALWTSWQHAKRKHWTFHS